MNASKAFISLVFSAVCSSLPPVEAIAAARENAEAIRKLSSSHELGHLVYLALKGTEEAEEYRADYERAVSRTVTIEKVMAKAFAALERAGIEFVPLKGALLRRLYPQAFMRLSCDVDVLVRPTERKKGGKALIKAGFKRTKRYDYHDSYEDAENGAECELHFDLAEKDDGIDAEGFAGEFFDSSVRENGTREPTAEYFVAHEVLHLAKHFFHGGAGVKFLLDFAVIDRYLDYDGAKLDEILARYDLKEFKDSIFSLVKKWENGEDGNEKLSDFILGSGRYGTLKNYVLSRKVAHGDGYAKNRLFPPFSQMASRYPVLSKHPYLLPVFWTVRAFSAFKPSKNKRIRQEMALNAQTNDESIRALAELYDEIGLKRANNN